MLSTFYPNTDASKKVQKGFTLLELLIVLAILAILAVVLIIVLNPAETLKRSRDAQRLSDLSSLKTALGIYVTSVNSPDLDAGIANHCLSGTNTAAQISYSVVAADATCAANVAEGCDVNGTSDPATCGADATSTFSATDFCRNVSATASAVTPVDGTGWVPVELSGITGGSPISSLPVDPTNTIAVSTAPASTDLVYRYACQATGTSGKPSIVFEFNAQLESDAYTVSDNKRATDGGDNTGYFEVGTSLKLIGAGSNF